MLRPIEELEEEYKSWAYKFLKSRLALRPEVLNKYARVNFSYDAVVDVLWNYIEPIFKGLAPDLMNLNLDGTPISFEKLLEEYKNLKVCPPDGGDYETIEIDDIDLEKRTIYLSKVGQSTFG